MSQQVKIDSPENATVNGVRGKVVFGLLAARAGVSALTHGANDIGLRDNDAAEKITGGSAPHHEATSNEKEIADRLYRHLKKLYTKGYSGKVAHWSVRNKFTSEAMAVKG